MSNMKRTKKAHKTDFLEDYNFSRHLNTNLRTAEDIQSRVRTIIKRFGWNPAMYPEHTRYVFWTIITGDTWGNFKRKLRDSQKSHTHLDETDPNVIIYSV